MTEHIPTIILIIGILIGTIPAGYIAHTINYLTKIDGLKETTILLIYVLIVSIGLTREYNRPIIITISSYLGIVTISRLLFNATKQKLPITQLNEPFQ